ncbi:MAG: response regulator [Acidobacteria bacterium]|nr:response regulator [Acidobacteriota bacterium]
MPTSRRSLVLVEDDRDSREMYVASLEHVGFDVFDAADAETGFVRAVKHQPRVVITDHLLKGGPTGAELCHRLKNDERTSHILTLLMTGVSDRRTAAGAIDLGCAIVRLKPYLPDAMIGDIEAMLRGDRLNPIPPEYDFTPVN